MYDRFCKEFAIEHTREAGVPARRAADPFTIPATLEMASRLRCSQRWQLCGMEAWWGDRYKDRYKEKRHAYPVGEQQTILDVMVLLLTSILKHATA